MSREVTVTNNRARILLLLTAPAWRGSGVSFGKIFAILREAGHQVSSVVSNPEVATRLSASGGGPVTTLPIRNSGWRARQMLRSFRGRQPFDLVVADSPRDVRLAALANLGPILWRFNLPNRPVPGDLWSRFLFGRVNHLVFQSHYIAGVAHQSAPWLTATEQSVIPNGYDLELLRPATEKRAAWRAAMEIPEAAPVLLTVAALAREKAIPESLAFSAALATRVPNLRHILIGEGEERARLEALAGPHARFLGGLDQHSTRDAIRAADLVLHFSPREVFSNLVAEAMALGAVVLGADSGGVAEVMGEAGVPVNPGDPETAVELAVQLLADPAQRQAIGRAARQRISLEFPLERMKHDWLDLVDRLVPPGRPALRSATAPLPAKSAQLRPGSSLLLTYDFPPMGGGIARWMEGLVRYSEPGDFLVSTGAVGSEAESRFDAALANPVDRLQVTPDRLRNLPGLRRWCRRAVYLARDPRVSFAWANPLRPAGIPAWWAQRRTGLPYGVILHGGDLLALEDKLRRQPWKRGLQRAVLGGASVLVVNSQWTAHQAEAALQRLRLPERLAAIRIVHPGTDPAHWQATQEAAEQLRTSMGLPQGRWLLSVARLVPHKGIDTAIDLMAALAPEYPDLYYAVAGRGPHRLTLETRARERGVADRVFFLDHLDDSQLPAVYRMAEVVLGLSREADKEVEGFGIAFLEAAASGRPVLAGSSGGVADAVVHGVTGLLVAPDNLPAILAAARQLLNHPEQREALGSAGRERVQQHYTWGRVVAQFQAIAAELGRR